MRIITFLLACSVIVSLSICFAAEPDESLTRDEYYSLGIPKKISDLREVENAYFILHDLSKKKKNVLPKYDSKKSKDIFNFIFDRKHILNALSNSPDAQSKTKLIQNYHKLNSRFWTMYMINATGNTYDDEIIRISVVGIHARVLLYEIHNDYYKQNNLKLKDAFPDEDQRYIYRTNLHDQICTAFIVWPDFKSDDKTTEYAAEQLSDFISRAESISYLENNRFSFNKKACFGLMKDRNQHFSNLQQKQ